MSFSIKTMCQHGDLVHRRKTAEAALKKAREMSRAGCYDIYITTPEGRDNHSSEFADLPRTPPLGERTRKLTLPIGKFRFRVPGVSAAILLANWNEARPIRLSPC